MRRKASRKANAPLIFVHYELRASQRLLPLLHADFILCDIFVRTARFASQPPPPFQNPPPAGVRYLADDLLRVHSSEVSACRGGFNDVGCNVLSDFVLRVCPTFSHNALRFCVVFVGRVNVKVLMWFWTIGWWLVLIFLILGLNMCIYWNGKSNLN